MQILLDSSRHSQFGKVKIKVIENERKGESEKRENEIEKEKNRGKTAWKISVLRLGTRNGIGKNNEEAGMKRDGVVVSAYVFSEKERWSSRENGSHEREKSEKRRRVDNSGKT